MAGVHVVVDVRDGAELCQRITHAVHVAAVVEHRVALRRAGGPVGAIGHEIRQRVDLDDGHDAQAGVFGPPQDVADRVDVLVLVARQVVRPELAIARERGAVATRQVVDHHLEHQWRGAVGLVLLHGRVQVIDESHAARGRAAVAGDGADAVEPDSGRQIGNGAASARRGVRAPLRIVVHRRARVRIVRPGSRVRWQRCGSR